MTIARRVRDAYHAAERRRTTLERIREQRAALDRDYSFSEQLEAAEGLGLAHAMPEPQEEMDFATERNQGQG